MKMISIGQLELANAVNTADETIRERRRNYSSEKYPGSDWLLGEDYGRLYEFCRNRASDLLSCLSIKQDLSKAKANGLSLNVQNLS